MKFTFRRMSYPLPGLDGQEIVQNFYHYSDFFIASEPVKDFLVNSAAGEAEALRVDVRHDNGRAAKDAYFAVKILRTIECVDLKKSMVNRSYIGEDFAPFEENLTSLSLTPELAKEFANIGGTKYVSCPHWSRTKSITLIESRIPADAMVFQPTLWPGHLIATPDFEFKLTSRCSGGSSGYYSWMLDLSDPSDCHRRLMHDLR